MTRKAQQKKKRIEGAVWLPGGSRSSARTRQHSEGKLPASLDFGIPAIRPSVDLLRSFFAEASTKIRIQLVDVNQ